MVCWDPRIEEMPKDELQRMQYKLLKSLVYRLYSFSPFYHDRMKEQKVHPDDIATLDPIFTTQKPPFSGSLVFNRVFPFYLHAGVDIFFLILNGCITHYRGVVQPPLSPLLK